jgi:zinc protease
MSLSKLSTKLLTLSGALLLAMGSYATAQDKDSDAKPAAATGEAWRKVAPEGTAPRPFKMPKVETYKLKNGMTVQLLEDHRVPFVTFNLGIKAGSTLEPPTALGLSSITAEMVTEGTRKKTSKQIAEEIDFIGGGLSAGSDFDFTLVSGSALSKYSDRLIDVVSDVVLNPSFPENELKLKKTNLLQELKMKRSQPDFLVDERFNKVLFGAHPYSVVAPTPESVTRMTRKDLQDFHKAHYLPNQAVLIVVGDFNSAKLKQVIERDLGPWKPSPMPVAQMPALPPIKGKRILLVDRPGSVQASIKLGNVGIKKTDPDYFPFMVANHILGGAAHSRLFLNIREQKGYTYGAYSGFAARKQPGTFAAEAEVRSDVTAPSLQEFLYELDRIRQVRVTDKELQDSKSYLTGSFQLGLETQSGLAQRLLESQLYDLPRDYLEKYTDRVMAVTTNDVRRVANKHIATDNVAIVVVGDAKKILPDLQFFGPVEVFETTGKPRKQTTSAAPRRPS